MLEYSQNYWNVRNLGSAQLVHKFIQGRERGKCGQTCQFEEYLWDFDKQDECSHSNAPPAISPTSPECLDFNCLKDWTILSHKHSWFIDLFVNFVLTPSQRKIPVLSIHVYKQNRLSNHVFFRALAIRYFSMSPGWFMLFVGLLVLFGEVLNCGLCWTRT